jgi:hypothetical protein
MEPDVSDYSCHRVREHSGLQVAYEMLKRSMGESLFFQVAGQASGQNVVGSIQGLFAKQINGRWVIAVIGGLLLRAHAESKEARTVEVFAGLPQGVRARDLVEVEEIKLKLRKGRPLSR